MRYFLQILHHKWFVLLAGLRTGAPLWRLVVHDWSKFLPSEFGPYRRRFTGPDDDREGFEAAWRLHISRNPHHAGYWKGAPMPWWALLEMVADWMAACRSYEGHWPVPGEWRWVQDHWDGLDIHPRSRVYLENFLIYLGYAEDIGYGEH